MGVYVCVCVCVHVWVSMHKKNNDNKNNTWMQKGNPVCLLLTSAQMTNMQGVIYSGLSSLVLEYGSLKQIQIMIPNTEC